MSDWALLWLSADRCMASAEQADDPAALAGAAWVVGNVWRATGREDDAYRLVRTSTSTTPLVRNPPGRSRTW